MRLHNYVGWQHMHTCMHALISERHASPPKLFWLDIVSSLLMKGPPQSAFSSIATPHYSLLPQEEFKKKKKKRNHTSSFPVPASLLFPRQQWQKIFPRTAQPIAVAVVWVAVLLGSVELAACVCAYVMCLCMQCGCCVYKWPCVHCYVAWMSAAGSARLSNEAAKLSWERRRHDRLK